MASLLPKFNEDIDDDKIIEPKDAIKLMQKVMVVLKQMNMSPGDICMVIV